MREEDKKTDGSTEETLNEVQGERQDGKPQEKQPAINGPDDDKKSRKAGRRRRRGRRKRGKKTGWIVLIVFLLLVAGAYAGAARFFDTHFLFSTTVNGEDFSLKSVGQVEAYMKHEVENYSLTLVRSDGGQEVIDGSSIDIQYTSAHELEKLVEDQNNIFWIESLWEPSKLKAQVGIGYDEEKLAQALSKLDCTDKEKQVKSKSAYPGYQNGAYEIVPEVQGTRLDEEKFQAAVTSAIQTSQKTLNLTQAGCYIAPKYTTASPEVTEALSTINQYMSAKITYDLNPDTEVVDASVIQPWIKLNKKKMKASLDGDAIKKYIQSLAQKYNTTGRTIDFTTADGDTVQVEGGGFGWQINQGDEYDALVADIKAGKVVTREPEHTGRSRSEKNGGIGDTYAEVDLTDQHMYYIKDGKVALESDIVTGNPNKGNDTPQGIYKLSYKTRNAVLRGQKKKDGTYEYETPVKYWMPFNGGIGFHDANWQSSFGGDRYKSHGSHGCVNMPEEKAKELYDLIQPGDPVVCHY